MLLWLGAVVVINQGFHMGSALLADWLGLRFVGRLRQAVITHLFNVSAPAVSHLHRGDTLARLSHDVDKVQAMVLELPFHLLSHLLTLLFYCTMLFWIDWQLALLALAFVPLFYLHQRLFGPFKRRAAERFYHENGELLTFEEQALANLRGISSVSAEERMGKRHQSVFEKARRWAMKMRWLDQSFEVILSSLIYLCGIVIVFVGIDRIQDADLGVGALVSFLIYLGYLSVPVRGFAQAPMQWQGDMGAAQRVLELLALEPWTRDLPCAKPLQQPTGAIRFDRVRFTYPEGEEAVLKEISLAIEPGETIALVGPSGGGKSTLARLLMRFYDPQAGAIYLDDTDLRNITLASLRQHCYVVWQDAFIVNDTIRANLLLARPEATEAQLLAACKASGAWSFIESLAEGIDTPIGAGGVELSGGQYQRLSIAQALLRDPAILILDEATSALDSHLEQKVNDEMARLRAGRTTLIIAHRYSSIRNADRVVYFNGDGSISIGQHEELLKSHEGYRQAVSWQRVATH